MDSATVNLIKGHKIFAFLQGNRNISHKAYSNITISNFVISMTSIYSLDKKVFIWRSVSLDDVSETIGLTCENLSISFACRAYYREMLISKMFLAFISFCLQPISF